MAGVFNGSNQYLQTPNDGAFSSGDQSMMAWINMGSTTGTQVVGSTVFTTNYNAPMTLMVRNGFPVAQIGYGYMAIIILIPVYESLEVSSGTTISTGTWHHLAASYQASNRTVYFYLDSVLVGSAAITRGGLLSAGGLLSGSSLTVAADQTGANSWAQHFNGRIEDFRFYNRYLTQAMIQTIYNTQGKDMMFDNLVVRFPLSEGTVGSTITGAALGELTSRTLAVTVGGTPTYGEGFNSISRRY